MEDDIDPDQLELHVDAGQQEDDHEERDRQIDSGRTAQELEAARSRTIPARQQPDECGDPDQVAQDREEGEEAGGVEGPGVRQHDGLGRDRCDHDDDRREPHESQGAAAIHGAHRTVGESGAAANLTSNVCSL